MTRRNVGLYLKCVSFKLWHTIVDLRNVIWIVQMTSFYEKFVAFSEPSEIGRKGGGWK